MLSWAAPAHTHSTAKHEKRVHVKIDFRVMSGKLRPLPESRLMPLNFPSCRIKCSSIGGNMKLHSIGKHINMEICKEEGLITIQT